MWSEWTQMMRVTIYLAQPTLETPVGQCRMIILLVIWRKFSSLLNGRISTLSHLISSFANVAWGYAYEHSITAYYKFQSGIFSPTRCYNYVSICLFARYLTNAFVISGFAAFNSIYLSNKFWVYEIFTLFVFFGMTCGSRSIQVKTIFGYVQIFHSKNLNL